MGNSGGRGDYTTALGHRVLRYGLALVMAEAAATAEAGSHAEQQLIN
jgi:hypothetical protein